MTRKFFAPSSGYVKSDSYPRPAIKGPRKATGISSYASMTDEELAKLDEALSADNELLKSALNTPSDDVVPDDRAGAGVSMLNSKFVNKIVAKLAEPLSAAIEFEVGKRLGHIEEVVDDALTPKQSTVTIQGGRARFKVTRKKADAPKGKKKIAAETVERRIERGEDGKITHVIDTKSDGTVVRHEVKRDMDGNMTGVTSETFVDAPPSLLERAKQR